MVAKNVGYKLPVPEDWRDTNLKTVVFVHQEASKRLVDTYQNFKDINNRSFRYISILTPITSVVLYIFILEVNAPGHYSFPGMLPALAVVMALCAYCLVRLAFLPIPRPIYVPGNAPEELASGQFLGSNPEQQLTHDEQYLSMLIGYVETIQDGIASNEATTSEMQAVLTSVLKTIAVTFSLTVTVLLGWWLVSHLV